MGDCKDSRLDQEQIKWLIYLLSGFCQNMIRVGFIYLLMEQFYERNWKEDIFMGKRAIAVLLGLCVIMTLPGFCLREIFKVELHFYVSVSF